MDLRVVSAIEASIAFVPSQHSPRSFARRPQMPPVIILSELALFVFLHEDQQRGNGEI